MLFSLLKIRFICCLDAVFSARKTFSLLFECCFLCFLFDFGTFPIHLDFRRVAPCCLSIHTLNPHFAFIYAPILLLPLLARRFSLWPLFAHIISLLHLLAHIISLLPLSAYKRWQIQAAPRSILLICSTFSFSGRLQVYSPSVVCIRRGAQSKLMILLFNRKFREN